MLLRSLPGPDGGGAYYVDGRSGNTPGPVTKKNGAKSGGSTVRLDPGTGLKPPNGGKLQPRPVQPPRAPTPVATAPNTGGAYTARSGNSAMDTIGNLNTSGNLNSAAGPGSGGPSLGRPPPLQPPKPPVASGPSKGGGGAGSASASSGGTGGWNGTQSQSGNSPAAPSGPRYTPTTKLGTKPSTPKFDDRIIDYGGCSSCNAPREPVVR